MTYVKHNGIVVFETLLRSCNVAQGITSIPSEFILLFEDSVKKMIERFFLFSHQIERFVPPICRIASTRNAESKIPKAVKKEEKKSRILNVGEKYIVF